MFENPRRGRKARNFTTNVPKILDLKSSSEQIFSENCRWVPLIVGGSRTQRFNCVQAYLHAWRPISNVFNSLFLLSLLFIAWVKVEGTVQGNNSGIGDIPKSRIPLTLKRNASRFTIDFLLTARIVRRSTKSLVPVLSEWVDSLRWIFGGSLRCWRGCFMRFSFVVRIGFI